MDDARRRPGEFLFRKLMVRNIWDLATMRGSD